MDRANSFSSWFASLRRKRNADEIKLLQSKLQELELKVQRLSSPGHEMPAPIVVEHIHIDKVVVDKVEYHNNFGALGIKELSGKLNIGANYSMSEGDTPMEEEGLQVLTEMRSAMRQAQDDHKSSAKQTENKEARDHTNDGGPKVKIRAKTRTEENAESSKAQ
ncbi:hypothetical protein ACFFK0_25450 [Paenibacillus chartarius]|uniref:Uncharacterized protein n=1 Tax=Paenibacillus chartarius TaxID=747481 RepID=A0ABV6DSX9_9BACL